MKKPFTIIAVGIFALVALLHMLRLIFGWEATFQGNIVPLWVSVVGVVIAGGLAFMVWRESRGYTDYVSALHSSRHKFPDHVTTVTCKVCAGEWPGKEQKIAEMGLSVAYLHDDQFFPGWTVLVLKRHATELFDLTREERSQLIEEVTEVERTLAIVFDAVKINYELLGNQLPHIHWHLIPRLADDPTPKEPVWRNSHQPKRLTPDALQERITLIRTQLKA